MLSTPLRSIGCLLACFACLPAFSATPGPETRDTLRIWLMPNESSESITIRAPEGGLDVYAGADATTPERVEPGTQISVSVHRGDVRLELPNGVIRSRTARIEPVEGGHDLSVAWMATQRSYQGSLVASAHEGRLRLINTVPLEDYVASVVSSEYGLDDLEGSKAMAVIARTYGLAVMKSRDDSYDHVDNTVSQVYRGTRTVTPLARQAAQLTRGEVLTYGGELIEAVYSSSSGGHTANNEDVWQSRPHPYLRAKKDPWDAIAPHSEWTVSVSRDRLHEALTTVLGRTIEGVQIEETTDGGRVRSVRLRVEGGRDRSIPAGEFRMLVNRVIDDSRGLRSTLFELDERRRDYVFEGSGFGHGVGMSQWGAHGMAKAGYDYHDILDFYYTGVTLHRPITEGPALAASAPAPAPRTDGRPATEEAVSPDGTPAASNQTAEQASEPSVERPRRRLLQRLGWGSSSRAAATTAQDQPNEPVSPKKKRRRGW